MSDLSDLVNIFSSEKDVPSSPRINRNTISVSDLDEISETMPRSGISSPVAPRPSSPTILSMEKGNIPNPSILSNDIEDISDLIPAIRNPSPSRTRMTRDIDMTDLYAMRNGNTKSTLSSMNGRFDEIGRAHV